MFAWKTKIETGAITIVIALSKATKQVCKDVTAAIKESSLFPPLKVIALEEWEKHQYAVLEHSMKLRPLLLDNDVQSFTNETNTRTMIAKFNAPTYEAVQKTPNTGTGWYHKQQTNMMAAMVPADLTDGTLLDNIAERVHEEAKKTLTTAFRSTWTACLRSLSSSMSSSVSVCRRTTNYWYQTAAYALRSSRCFRSCRRRRRISLSRSGKLRWRSRGSLMANYISQSSTLTIGKEDIFISENRA
ncbi:hypothetical protein BU23DRAFT_309171 [Bimuria novae-zelandiae CBS 107.79]|uniref:Uncharacterized protein n=1 Tax=Bimuria novae-zelandiae CBS 107.79 TaxID=1447943 RepID=A0A6A5UQN6_9PLEO|nr:hypothetical protein BU23DRAFT_309171 [Bimuria novae-zelandiae CBS 107.79]